MRWDTTEPTRRIRYLTHEEADRLLLELPPHLRDMAAFGLTSGLRAANVTGLRWSAVDIDRRLAWVNPDEAKARKAIPVPLNGEAVAILQKQIGKHREVVLTSAPRVLSHHRIERSGARRMGRPVAASLTRSTRQGYL
jgi:integrase